MIRGLINRVKRLVKPAISHNKIFSEIYQKNIWGTDGESQFYSGSGSDDEHAHPYVTLIRKFILENDIRSIVDLGSGDFRVGRAIIKDTDITYTGVDVVKDLVDYNNRTYGKHRLSFLYRNITSDRLPKGDLCLIRQVLQHLSNSDIKKTMKKCRQYKYLIVTEHLPIGEDVPHPNIDKVPDGSIRYYENSGVYLDLPPFNYKLKELLRVEPKDHPGSKIVTFQIHSS